MQRHKLKGKIMVKTAIFLFYILVILPSCVPAPFIHLPDSWTSTPAKAPVIQVERSWNHHLTSMANDMALGFHNSLLKAKDLGSKLNPLPEIDNMLRPMTDWFKSISSRSRRSIASRSVPLNGLVQEPQKLSFKEDEPSTTEYDLIRLLEESFAPLNSIPVSSVEDTGPWLKDSVDMSQQPALTLKAGLQLDLDSSKKSIVSLSNPKFSVKKDLQRHALGFDTETDVFNSDEDWLSNADSKSGDSTEQNSFEDDASKRNAEFTSNSIEKDASYKLPQLEYILKGKEVMLMHGPYAWHNGTFVSSNGLGTSPDESGVAVVPLNSNVFQQLQQKFKTLFANLRIVEGLHLVTSTVDRIFNLFHWGWDSLHLI